MDKHDDLAVGHRHQETNSRLRWDAGARVARSRGSETT
jgi:hypothetical protein